MPQDNKFVWNYNSKNDILQLDYPPGTLLKLFMSDDVVQSIAVSSVQYARQKGNHTFQLTSDDVRLFIAILFICGYLWITYKRDWLKTVKLHTQTTMCSFTDD